MKTIAYLGPENTYTHRAAMKKFGPRCSYLHAPTIEDVFHLVEREQADFGVVPIENSLGGSVVHTLDRFIDFKHSPVTIHGEIEYPIQHCLITQPGVKKNHVRVVFSHPQALTQCHRWLDRNIPNVQRHETNSTAEAVQFIADDKRSKSLGPLDERAAIGMEELAKPDKLQATPIPLGSDNKTRFLILGLGQPKAGKTHKTSLLCALKDQPGALLAALAPFERNKINLSKIESRPSKKQAWEYMFFIDIEGHVDEPRIQKALKAVEKQTAMFHLLGSYPVATKRKRTIRKK